MNKVLERLIRLLQKLISFAHLSHHKFQNKNQITNTNLIVNLLKLKGFNPNFIVDVGCGYGEWTKKIIRIYPNSKYILFDADFNNFNKLKILKNYYDNINFKICLLSNIKKNYTFYSMGYGSSIFEENTKHPRKKKKIKSTTLYDELKNKIYNSNNLLKLDVQGAEMVIIKGLRSLLNKFEAIILETSLHNYNKNAPLFYEIHKFMNLNGYKLYDIYDLKRLGEFKSYLLQFDCLFVKKNSDLNKIKF